MLDKITITDTVKQYVDAVTNEFSPSAIILFGSCLSGNMHKDSDIDIGIIFDGFNGDWKKTSSQLWRLCQGISFDIEPHLLDSKNDKSGFVKHVLKIGQIVYTAQ